MTRLSIKVRETLSIPIADGLLHLILFSLTNPLGFNVVVSKCTCVELFIFFHCGRTFYCIQEGIRLYSIAAFVNIFVNILCRL